MFFKKLIGITLVLALLISLVSFGATAESPAKLPANLTDNKVSTKTEIKSTLQISDTEATYLYIIFWDKPVDFTLSNDSLQRSFEFKGEFLHQLVEIPKDLVGAPFTITFKTSAKISEIKTFDKEPSDSEVQKWEDNNEVCDLLLFSTHADDEQLFFSGVLPLYATDGQTEVQVVYFTDHNNNILRRHELLDGLWEVGVTRYPVISNFPDAYSESYEGALNNLKNAGFSEQDALAFQVEQIRKYEPLVVLGHDLKGEYGHGQHILNATLLTKAVVAAANGDEFSDIAFGPHDTPKLYLHLYGENKIELDLDTPIISENERFNGKTPFELSKLGFAKHGTQQGTWFKTWLNGKNGQITKATEINSYSPRKFGLYRSTVGEDINKNDLFENLTRRALIPPEPQPEPEPEPTPEPEVPNERQTTARTLIITLFCLLGASLCFLGVKK